MSGLVIIRERKSMAWRFGKHRQLHSTQSNSGEEGAALFEMAMVMPVALLVLTGLLSFATFINNNLELANATSLAGQYLALSRSTTAASDPCNVLYSSFEQVAPCLDPAKLTFQLTFNGGSPNNGTTCTSAATSMAQGANAQIIVKYPCTLGMYGVNFAPTCSLTSQITEIIQ